MKVSVSDRLCPGESGGVKKRRPNSSCYRSKLVEFCEDNPMSPTASSAGIVSPLWDCTFIFFPSLINTPAQQQKLTSKVFLHTVCTHGHPHALLSLNTHMCTSHMMWMPGTFKSVLHREKIHSKMQHNCFPFFYTQLRSRNAIQMPSVSVLGCACRSHGNSLLKMHEEAQYNWGKFGIFHQKVFGYLRKSCQGIPSKAEMFMIS